MYYLTVGLEVHIKIASATKLFCGCANIQDFDTVLPNTHICPVCTGQPGALPVLSRPALYKALVLGRALGCRIQHFSSFDRKSYFYPDLPMGYQITQYFVPTCVEGSVQFYVNNFSVVKSVSIRQAHIETDTAKMIHQGGQAFLDFNRSGTPLVEIVTNPDFHSAEEVIEFLKELQRIVRYNDISDADMEKGQLRVDVNVSCSADTMLGTRVELKNLNSFGAIKRAIEYEYTRQVGILQSGGVVDRETRAWDDVSGTSYSMRSKETALDYRYFPDPDLPILDITSTAIDYNAITVTVPFKIIQTLREEYGFHKEYIHALVHDKAVLDYFLSCVSAGCDPRTTAKRIAGPILAHITAHRSSIHDLPFSLQDFIHFVNICTQKQLREPQLKIVLDNMLREGLSPDTIIAQQGFVRADISDQTLYTLCTSVLNDNPDVVQQYRNGKYTTIAFFVGQVMKRTSGKANPQDVKRILEELLHSL